MSPVRTRLRTDAGWLDFQDYFVRRRCEPVVQELMFQGDAASRIPSFWPRWPIRRSTAW